MAQQQKILSTFTGGIDQDTSVNKYDNQHYYDATNMRIITNDSLESGALSSIPAPEIIEYIDLGATNDLKVIGTAQIRDTSILFIADNTLDRSLIVKFTIEDNAVVSSDIIYDDTASTYKLGFTQSSKIQAVGRYESEDIQKVYWVDNSQEDTELRYINIMQDYMTPFREAYVFNMSGYNSALRSPQLVERISGGNLTSGKICYAFQYFEPNGTTSAISSLSPLICVSSRLGDLEVEEYYGDEESVGGVPKNSNMSVKLKFTDLDTNYSNIRIFSIHYRDIVDEPIIKNIGEIEFDSSEIIFTDTGNTELDTYSTEEFAVLQNKKVFSAKTLEVKNDILFAGNIKEFSADIPDFDARAYRFTENPGATGYNDYTATIYDVEGNVEKSIVASGATANYPNFTTEKEFDCIDYINDYESGEINGFGLFSATSRLQGGSGPNIRYSFYQNKIDYPHNKEITDSITRGYKSNEVYRFGIEFVFKNGKKSPVKWIGDIRFPLIRNTGTSDAGIGKTISDYDLYYGNILPQIDVNLSSLSQDELDSLQGFRLVRAIRNDSNKNIISQGLVALFSAGFKTSSSEYNSNLVVTNTGDGYVGIVQCWGRPTTMLENSTLVGLYYHIDPTIEGRLSTETNPFPYLYYKGGAPTSVNRFTFNKELGIQYISPEYIFNKEILDCNILSIVDAPNVTIIYNTSISDNVTDYNCSTIILPDTSDFTSLYCQYPVGYNLGFPILQYELVYQQGKFVAGQDYQHLRSSYSNYSGIYFQGYAQLCSHQVITTGHNNIAENLTYIPKIYGQERFLIGELVKNLFGGQYGGNSYENRSYTEYIGVPCKLYESGVGEVDLIKELITIDDYNNYKDVGGYIRCIGYGGDTYLSRFKHLFNHKLNKVDSNFTMDLTTECENDIQFESTINIPYRRDEFSKFKRNVIFFPAEKYSVCADYESGIELYPEDYPRDLTDLYIINDAYNRDNDLIKSLPEAVNTNFTTSNDCLIIASNKKFNNELEDSWLKFDTNTELEIDSKYGSLNALINFRDTLYAFQETGIARIAVNDRYTVTANSLSGNQQAEQLSLGAGSVLERYDYVETYFGIERPEAVLKTPNNLFYVSERDKSIRRLGEGTQGEFSVISGIHSLLSEVGNFFPTVDLALGYDKEYREVYFTFGAGTILYNELLNTITCRMPTISTIIYHIVSKYIQHPDKLYSAYADPGTDNGINIVSYNEDVDVMLGAKCSITLLLHPNGNNVYTFTNLDLRTNIFDSFTKGLPNYTDETFDIFSNDQYKNSYLSSSTRSLIPNDPSNSKPNIKRLGRIWRTNVPLSSNGNRFVDTYLLVTLTYNQTGGKNPKVILHDVIYYAIPSNH